MNNLDKLRRKMLCEGVDVVYVTMGDYHQSEYSEEYFDSIKFLSGFTGSNAYLVVDKDNAVLFTDGRYFLQAEKELQGSDIVLMRMGCEGVPEIDDYILSIIKEGETFAFDGRIVSAHKGAELTQKLSVKNVTVKCDFDSVKDLWDDRPALSLRKAFVLEEKYSGESAKSKISRIKEEMKRLKTEIHIVSSLDDVAWILNIRGRDITYNPVLMSYLVIGEETHLFTNPEKIDETVCEYLKSIDVKLREYDEFYDYISKLENVGILIDNNRINYLTLSKLSENKCVYKENPSVLMKAIKNKTELENLKRAHIKDGVAVTRFIIWLKENVSKQQITEYTAAQKLRELRMAQDGYIEDSFETICAYKENAAMMHYSCNEEIAKILEPKGMILVDSGGQYYEGTTDVTRTFALGEVTSEEKRSFTLALKGMFNLSNARFLYGCRGVNLDILARGPLWEAGIDYRCSTGHGVSYLLNVHEGPNNIRWKLNKDKVDSCVLEEGMVTSNEPGVYEDGKYGIRIENEIVCLKDIKNDYGQFMRFDTLTMVPIDTSLIDETILNEVDKKRINDYNRMSISSILPYFDEKEADWIEKNVKILY